MCARVCPTEVLCEQACVRNTQEDKPVEIGALQRHATDAYFAKPGAAAVHARAGQRQARGGGRRRAGRAGLRAPAGDARPRGDAVRRQAQARRPERIRPGHLQDGGRLRAEGDRLAAVDRRHRGQATAQPRPRHAPRRAGARLRRGVPGPGPGRRQRARHRRAGGCGGARAVDFIAELRQAASPARRAGRPARARHRRRHDRGGRRRAEPAARRRGRDHRLPPRARGHVGRGYEQQWAQTNGVLIQHWGAPKRCCMAERPGAAACASRARALRGRAGWSRPASTSTSRPTWCSRPSARASRRSRWGWRWT